jgi:hypothetical protein
MGMVAEVPRKRVCALREDEVRVRDAVRVGNQRVARKAARVAGGACLHRNRPQHIDAAKRELRNGASGRGREDDARVAGG